MRSKCFTFLCALSFLCFNLASERELASEKDLELFREAKFLNEDAIALSVGFYNYTKDPYPRKAKGYNVDIDYSKTCYVSFQDLDRTTYNIIESTSPPESEYGSYVTHTGPCGVCSSLQDLAVYISRRDLTTPVTKCAKMIIPSRKKQCLRNLGFSERCLYIWYWNTIYTRRGCLNICLRYQNSPRNQPSGKYNPCKPYSANLPILEPDPDADFNEDIGDSKDNLVDMVPSEQTVTSNKHKRKKSQGLLKSLRVNFDTDKSFFSVLTKKRRKVGCRNSINNKPACDNWQWKDGPKRLNPCIQCDECKSGPMFQKVSGRQRRNSGISSGIYRPNVAVLDHHYYTGMRDISYLKQEL